MGLMHVWKVARRLGCTHMLKEGTVDGDTPFLSNAFVKFKRCGTEVITKGNKPNVCSSLHDLTHSKLGIEKAHAPTEVYRT